MATPRVWTLEEDAKLFDEYGITPTLELAIKLDRSVNSLQVRAHQLCATKPPISEDPEFSYAQLMMWNAQFVAAMAKAIKEKKERPPMVGIDRRPCTKRPVYMDHGETHIARPSLWANVHL